MTLVKHLKHFTRNYVLRLPVRNSVTNISSRFVNEFDTFYPTLVDKTISQIKYVNNTTDVQEQLRALTKQHLMKKPRQSEFLLYVYELLEKPGNLNEKKIYQGYVLGCFQEMMQAYFNTKADVLHKSETRDEKTCWYLLPCSNNLGLNDITLFRCFMNEMIKQNFDEATYVKLMNLTNEMYLNMESSLHLDYETKGQKNFTIDTYDRIQMFKANGCGPTASIKLALLLSNIGSKKSFDLVEDLCGDFGVLVQINNDFTEYMDHKKSITSKPNINTGFISWPAVAALQHFDTEQRGIFEENYGKSGFECEKAILKLYEEINLEKVYQKEKEYRCKNYLYKVNKIPSDAIPCAHILQKILDFHVH